LTQDIFHFISGSLSYLVTYKIYNINTVILINI
jgi:hypothetical protein